MANKQTRETWELVQKLHDKHHKEISKALRGWAEKHPPVFADKARQEWQMIHEATTCEGWQIDRYYVADYKRYKRTGQIVLDDLFTAYEYWFNPKTHQYARLVKPIGMCAHWHRIPFSRGNWYGKTALDISKSYNGKKRANTSPYYYNTDWYEGWNNIVHYPRQRVLKDYAKMNLAYLFTYEEEFHKILKGLTRGNALETISKTGMGGENMLRAYFKYDRADDIEASFRSLVVANRHGYLNNVSDLEMYLDYLGEVRYLKLDDRNPHYICPKDLIKAHNELSARVSRKKAEFLRKMNAKRQERQERENYERMIREAELRVEREERDRQRAKSCEDVYAQGRGMFFGLEFGNAKYDVSVLKSVEEFLNEGIAMHHCVFSASYYDLNAHPNSLILSVRNKQGERQVTVEYNIKTNEIKQCFAKYDSIHADDKGIRALVMAHSQEIDAIAHPKTRKKSARVSA